MLSFVIKLEQQIATELQSWKLFRAPRNELYVNELTSTPPE